MGFDLDPGIEGLQSLRPRLDLGLANVGGLEQDLALKVGQADGIVVHQPQLADPRRRQIKRHRIAQAAGPHHQHPGGADFGLAYAAHLAQHQVAGITLQLLVVQHRFSKQIKNLPRNIDCSITAPAAHFAAAQGAANWACRKPRLMCRHDGSNP